MPDSRLARARSAYVTQEWATREDVALMLTDPPRHLTDEPLTHAFVSAFLDAVILDDEQDYWGV